MLSRDITFSIRLLLAIRNKTERLVSENPDPHMVDRQMKRWSTELADEVSEADGTERILSNRVKTLLNNRSTAEESQ